MFDLGLQLNRPKYDSELLGRWMLAAGMPTLFLVRVSKKKVEQFRILPHTFHRDEKERLFEP
jgi:hypothetical protein